MERMRQHDCEKSQRYTYKNAFYLITKNKRLGGYSWLLYQNETNTMPTQLFHCAM